MKWQVNYIKIWLKSKLIKWQVDETASLKKQQAYAMAK
jgi:hypothetical protein